MSIHEMQARDHQPCDLWIDGEPRRSTSRTNFAKHEDIIPTMLYVAVVRRLLILSRLLASLQHVIACTDSSACPDEQSDPLIFPTIQGETGLKRGDFH